MKITWKKFLAAAASSLPQLTPLILITAALVVGTGTGIYEAREILQLCNQVETLALQPAPSAEQRQKLLRELDDATNQLAAANAKIARLTLPPQRQEGSQRAIAGD